MAATSPPPPHQDPTTHTDPTRVTVMEYVTTVIAGLDRRFGAMYTDLKECVAQRFDDSDLRYQQRFDAQTKAMDAALAAQKEAVQIALIAAEKAVAKAEIAAEKRFDATNEFREQLRDQAATLIPRNESEVRMAAIGERIDEIRATVEALSLSVRANAARGAGLAAGWGYLVGGVGLVGAVIAIITRH